MIVTGECISRSCTTGWLDWVHGELWLLPAGLIRRRLTLAATRAHGLGPTVTAPISCAELDVERIRGEHPTNVVINFADVRTARLRRGRTTDALRVEQHGGTTYRLLWLPRDPAHDLLASALADMLS